MTDLDAGEWARLLDGLDAPSVGEAAEALADYREGDVSAAYDTVEAALDDGLLVETDAGMFGAVQVPDHEGGDEDDDTDGDRAPVEQRAHEAFAAACEFFHSQLDRDISDQFDDTDDDGWPPATPREYYEDVRGWSADLIEEKQLGWAPADETALLDHLMRRGFDRDAILGSGLFYEGLTPHFVGRFVLPYFDEDGAPVYAISRSLAEDDGGHEADPKGEQKYTKAVKTKDYSHVDEPIYGAETVDEDTDRLLVAGGIADAMTLHEAGHACVSPVTTVRFKEKHEPRVVDLVDRYDLEGVYMLNDAERPSVDATELADDETADCIRDVLTIMQFGEGLRGAFGNAEFLLDEGVDTYLVELPGGDDDLRKLDPDDLVKEGWADVDTLLAAARPAEDHRGYQQWVADRQQRQAQQARDTGAQGGAATDSALFDLQFTDVTGMSVGDRANNPLGHHGNSEGYFVCCKKGTFRYGYDHKYNVAYNALTYLLCEAGERRADSPNGALDDDEVFVAWRHAMQKGYIRDEPVPYTGLRGVAIRDGLLDADDLVDREGDGDASSTYRGFPDAETYNATLDHVRETYEVDPNRETAEAGAGEAGDPTSAVPVGLLDKLDDDEARRVARQHGVDWPDTTEARQQLRDRVLTAMRGGERTVLDAPTALGKSYTVATEPWRTRADAAGERPVVQFHETREARDQAAEHSSDAGVTYRVLRGRTEACDCAAGDHDPAEGDDEDNDRQVITMAGTPASRWFEAVCEGRGVPFSVAHQYLAEHNDQGVDLPCGGDGCLAITQWDGVPTDDDGQATADVIHATHGFAHVPSLRLNTNMVFDERPDFRTDLSTDRVQQIIAAYLQHVDAPVETWEQFVATARTASDDAHSREHRDRVGDAIEAEPSRDWYLEDPDAHTLAPALTRAVWFALLGGTDTNGRFDATVPHEPPRLDAEASGDDGYNRVWLSVVLDDDHRVRTARTAPDVSQARSVIGLDAHPTPSLWTANLGEDMTRDTVLDTDARRHWRRLERGLTIVQVGEATRPYTSGEYFDHEGTGELVDALRGEFGADFGTAITAASVEADHRDLLAEAGVDDPETMHYGEEKSRDDFATERVGLVSGCIDPGDGYVLDLLAELGCDAEPELVECPECDGAGCEADPDCRDGQRRAHGREFVGDDADTASALLASVRENHVAQAAGRYARDADGDGGALVFVRTDAMPPGYADLQVPGVEWVPTDLQAEIIDTLAARPAATAAEVADAVDCTKEHVRETLVELHERDVVDVREGAGDHGAHLYRALAGVDVGAGVALEGDQTTNDDVWCSYTWSLAVSPPTTSASVAQQASTRPTTADRPEVQAGLTAFGDAPPPE
jgi:hypothetical protein